MPLDLTNETDIAEVLLSAADMLGPHQPPRRSRCPRATDPTSRNRTPPSIQRIRLASLPKQMRTIPIRPSGILHGMWRANGARRTILRSLRNRRSPWPPPLAWRDHSNAPSMM